VYATTTTGERRRREAAAIETTALQRVGTQTHDAGAEQHDAGNRRAGEHLAEPQSGEEARHERCPAADERVDRGIIGQSIGERDEAEIGHVDHSRPGHVAPALGRGQTGHEKERNRRRGGADRDQERAGERMASCAALGDGVPGRVQEGRREDGKEGFKGNGGTSPGQAKPPAGASATRTPRTP
jgi:hypothetical protein